MDVLELKLKFILYRSLKRIATAGDARDAYDMREYTREVIRCCDPNHEGLYRLADELHHFTSHDHLKNCVYNLQLTHIHTLLWCLDL